MKKYSLAIVILALVGMMIYSFTAMKAMAQTDEEIRTSLVQKLLSVLVMQVNTIDAMLVEVSQSSNPAQFNEFIILLNNQLDQTIQQTAELLKAPTSPSQNTSPEVVVGGAPIVVDPPPVNPPTTPPVVNPPSVIVQDVDASLKTYTQNFPLNSSRVILVEMNFVNNSTEPVKFISDANTYITTEENTIPNWQASLFGVFKGKLFPLDNVVMSAGESGVVYFFLENIPTEAGSFKVRFNSYSLVGVESGSLINVDGFPIETGIIIAE